MIHGHSCLVDKPDERDYVLGDGNISLTPNVPNGDWTPYFFFSEFQKLNGFETDGCVIFDFQERFDAFMEFLIQTNQIPQNVLDFFKLNNYFDSVNSDDKKPHFHTSPRYIQILTGNGQNGNAFTDPCKAAQQNGMIPWTDLDFSADDTNVKTYFAPIPQTLLDKGKVFLSMMGGKNFIKYHWIFNNTNSSVPFSSLDQARQIAPLGIGINVGINWNSDEPPPPPVGSSPGHAVSNFTRVPDGEEIEDHYLPFHKLLVNGYPIPQAFQMVIVPPLAPPPTQPINTANPQSLSAWSQWLGRVASWLRNILDPQSLGAARSPKWPEVRKEHLQKFPRCAACGQTDMKKLAVHHKLPFHLHPEKELLDENLITLCGKGPVNCHYLFGHCDLSWSCYNPMVETDVRFTQKVRDGASK